VGNKVSNRRIAIALERLATTLENLENFFIATSVEEVQKRVEDMKKGRQ